MNRVDTMLDMIEDDSVCFLRFISDSYKKEYTFFFLEGDDDIDYYQQFFRNFSFPWEDFVCDGRDNVIALYHDLKNHKNKEYNELKVFGFIDKDYHEININNKDIYTTPTYSIENLYISDDCIKRILNSKFNLKTNSDVFNSCFTNFNDRISDFIKLIEPLDIILRANNINYIKHKSGAKINVKNIKLDQYFKISFDEVLLKKDIIIDLDIDTSKISSNSMATAKSFNKNCNNIENKKFIRGKFLFYFVTKYLSLLIKDNNIKENSRFFSEIRNEHSKKRIKFKSTKLKIDNEKPDALLQLATFADVPNCLNDFFKYIDTKHN